MERPYTAAVPEKERRALAQRVEAVRAAGGPVIRVVLVDLTPGGPFQADPGRLAGVLHDHLGGTWSLFTVQPEFGSLRGIELPDRADGEQTPASAAASAIRYDDSVAEAPMARQLAYAIDLLASGDAVDTHRRGVERERAARAEETGTEDQDAQGGGAMVVAGIAGGLAALVGSLALLAVFRRSRHRLARQSPFVAPRQVLLNHAEANEAALRADARKELLAYGRELRGRRMTGDGERLRLALDAYEAAGRVLDDARDRGDLIGVLAVLAEGRAALRGEELAPLCFFQPLHGRGTDRVAWQPVPDREPVRVAACAECGELVRRGTAPSVLTVRHRGRTIPYFEVPSGMSLWAATGYGSFEGPPLTDRVVRGEFTRTR
ncbi:hypothetical protein [Streptomyces sp. JJ38]|uniref:hypothetical protein n=1 Tax=Streptomyces sp. JJ38 TaxID=2738128 RepID=UPI001C58D36D|nr:hypothetical protein [Streptomyces sp. JJ38]MBW1597411.1 hypothetical protein [Streptomyces sp. JJ38]